MAKFSSTLWHVPLQKKKNIADIRVAELYVSSIKRMYLSTLSVSNYKSFEISKFTVYLNIAYI